MWIDFSLINLDPSVLDLDFSDTKVKKKDCFNNMKQFHLSHKSALVRIDDAAGTDPGTWNCNFTGRKSSLWKVEMHLAPYDWEMARN